MLYLHQHGHSLYPPLSVINRWFTRYLHGVENGVENDPPVWIVREHEDRNSPTAYTAFPNPGATPVKLYPGPGAPQRGTLGLNPVSGAGTEFLVDDYHYAGSTLATRDSSYNRLLFVTPPLTDSVHISGIPELTIRLTSTKKAANLSAWLVSLPWEEGAGMDITDNLITRGWADPQNASSVWESKPLRPGDFVEMTFPLQPDDQVIPPGQRIGLMIFSTDREFTLWPFPGTKLIVDLEQTFLTLPVVGGEPVWMEATGGKRDEE
jgi:X-Pro dipeptidyl-peptidase